jgi:hypothetical protein
MTPIHIKITGLPQCGKTTLAELLHRYLDIFGFEALRTENGRPIPQYAQTIMENHFRDLSTADLDQRTVIIDEQWAGPSPETVKAIAEWFITGQVGSSSKSLAAEALGIEVREIDYPRDTSDFNRCLMLIDRAPEVRHAVDTLARKSEAWLLLVRRWDLLESSFLREAGLNWSKAHAAPHTYDMMCKTLAPLYGKP